MYTPVNSLAQYRNVTTTGFRARFGGTPLAAVPRADNMSSTASMDFFSPFIYLLYYYNNNITRNIMLVCYIQN